MNAKVTMRVVTHALPKALQMDEVVRIGTGTIRLVEAEHDGILKDKR